MSAILRDALGHDEPSDEPKTLLEIGVAVKRPLTTRTTIITPTPIIHSQHLLHHLTSAPAPPATSSSHLQHHLSSQFTPIHQHHRPAHHPWSHPIDMVTPPAYPLHSSYPPHHNPGGEHNGNSHGHSMGGLVANNDQPSSQHGDPNRYPTDSAGSVEHKITRVANATWKDRAIQIERGDV